MKTLGKYQILEQLGAGAMGAVYRARDTILERDVAIKVVYSGADLNSEIRQRFYREARACAQLRHPHIVTIYDLGEQENEAYIVMELLEGADLRRIIAEKRDLSVDAKIDLATQVAEGLAHAHRHGIVHRDVKPGNIFLHQGDCAKILDFGIARIPFSRLTLAGSALGTPDYMAPEQISGKGCDARSDLFSAAIVFYEFLAYAHPFRGRHVGRIVSEAPVPLRAADPRLPASLEQVISRGLEKDPRRRYQTGEEFAAALRAVRLDTPSRPLVVVTTTSRPATPRRALGAPGLRLVRPEAAPAPPTAFEMPAPAAPRTAPAAPGLPPAHPEAAPLPPAAVEAPAPAARQDALAAPGLRAAPPAGTSPPAAVEVPAPAVRQDALAAPGLRAAPPAETPPPTAVEAQAAAPSGLRAARPEAPSPPPSAVDAAAASGLSAARPETAPPPPAAVEAPRPAAPRKAPPTPGLRPAQRWILAGAAATVLLIAALIGLHARRPVVRRPALAVAEIVSPQAQILALPEGRGKPIVSLRQGDRVSILHLPRSRDPEWIEAQYLTPRKTYPAGFLNTRDLGQWSSDDPETAFVLIQRLGPADQAGEAEMLAQLDKWAAFLSRFGITPQGPLANFERAQLYVALARLGQQAGRPLEAWEHYLDAATVELALASAGAGLTEKVAQARGELEGLKQTIRP